MIHAVKGTRDILPPASDLWNEVDERARDVFRAFNYHEIRTPIFEETLLFARGVGEETDIVTKEMYTFEDRDGASVTLRPECTASVIRAYIEHRLDQQPGILKLFYMGPMFRRERPQKGRFRQFYQIGAEAIGSESPEVDAEVVELAVEILRGAGLAEFRLLVNSVGCAECRPKFMAGLRLELRKVAPTLCSDCRRRVETNPLRVLDCKVKADQAVIDSLPSILDHLCEACQTHFDTVRRYLQGRGIDFEVRPRLVRGLDYYTRTTFEITHGALGAQNSVVGGGRYDGLAEALGSKVRSPGIGFSIGEDRLIMSLEEAATGPRGAGLDLFIAPIGEAAFLQTAVLARELRRLGKSVELGLDSKLKRSLELANKLGARYALIAGEAEIAAGNYQLKDMATGEQQTVTRSELFERLGIGI
jgi:histidyl-tRNA synthetase